MKSKNRIRSFEITSELVYLQRRKFLREAGWMAGAGLVSMALPGSLMARPEDLNTVPGPFSTDESPNSWEDITTYNNFYEFGTGKDEPYRNARNFVTRPWSVKVSGQCEKPGDYDFPGGPRLPAPLCRGLVNGGAMGRISVG
jgi:sulfoxide reductase catalytic subunit YedY